MTHSSLLTAACALGLATVATTPAHAGDALKLGVFAHYDLLRFDEAPAPLDDASFWRRGRASLGGKLANGADWKAEYDWVPDAWTDAYLRLPVAGGKLWLGQFKQPLGQEALTSDKVALFTESSVSSAFAPGRKLGAQYVRSQGWGTFAVSAYGHDIHDAGPDKAFAARLFTSRGTSATGLFHVGGAVAREDAQTPTTRLRLRPETGFKGGSWLSTGNLRADDLTRYGLEASWQQGALLIQSELLGTRFEPDAGPKRSGNGGYVAVSWTLHGAPRVYKDGLFSIPDAGDSLFGNVELVARYSRVDLPAVPVGGIDQDAWTVGLNAQLGKQWRVLFDYSAAEDQMGRDASALTLRTQFAY